MQKLMQVKLHLINAGETENVQSSFIKHGELHSFDKEKGCPSDKLASLILELKP